MIATLLRLAGIDVNVKYGICSWQSGQKNTSWIGRGGGEHIYIYIYEKRILRKETTFRFSFFVFRFSGHQRPPAQLGSLRGLRGDEARRRRLGDEPAPGFDVGFVSRGTSF